MIIVSKKQGGSMPSEDAFDVWIDHEGKGWKISDLSDSHLANIIKMLSINIKALNAEANAILAASAFLSGDMASHYAELDYDVCASRIEELQNRIDWLKNEQQRRQGMEVDSTS